MLGLHRQGGVLSGINILVFVLLKSSSFHISFSILIGDGVTFFELHSPISATFSCFLDRNRKCRHHSFFFTAFLSFINLPYVSIQQFSQHRSFNIPDFLRLTHMFCQMPQLCLLRSSLQRTLPVGKWVECLIMP